MAIDDWLLDQHCQGLQPSILRFYTWKPIAISLGYHQRQWPIHWQDLQWQGQSVPLVRRPSGGRAVLHQGELTYTVITTSTQQNRRATYCNICQFLRQAGAKLGWNLNFGQAGRGYHQQTNCFRVATTADLVLSDGYKLIGSAQLWRGPGVLQHGSIRLTPDPELFEAVFQEPLITSSLLSSEHSQSSQVLQTALLEAATDHFQVSLRQQPLSEAEWQAIATHNPARFQVSQDFRSLSVERAIAESCKPTG